MRVSETPEAIGRRFHGLSARTIVARVRPAQSPIVISHVISEMPKPEKTLAPPPQSAYAIHVHHKPLYKAETWINGKHAQAPTIAPGSLCVFDLETSPTALIQEPLDFTRFSLTRATLNDLAYERGQSGISHLRIPALGHPDRVIEGLAFALISRARTFGQETDSLFADWIGLAFHAHVVDTYGDAKPANVACWSISPRRLRQVCEWTIERLDEPLSIAQLAAQTDMTSAHFARAFRRATGEPPHQWLMRRRIERAKDLLQKADASLAEIAATCGFADQSHLTRVFRRIEGATPGRWRQLVEDQPGSDLRSANPSGSRQRAR